MINNDLFVYSPERSLYFKEILKICKSYNKVGIKYQIIWSDGGFWIKCLKSSIPKGWGF